MNSADTAWILVSTAPGLLMTPAFIPGAIAERMRFPACVAFISSRAVLSPAIAPNAALAG